MTSMANVWNKNCLFISLSLILIAVLGLALLYVPKGELHLLLCDRHTPARDLFYRYYTTMAEWFPYIVCGAVLLFGRIGDGIFASAAMIGSSLSTQVLKHIINAPRPITWFGEHMPEVELPLVEGVRMNHWFSFPSGHTTSFFALALVLCILLTRGGWRGRKDSIDRRNSIYRGYVLQLLLFVAATLGAYSRIYLSQHFALDVLAGIMVGVSITLLCYGIFSRFEGQKWYNYRVFSKK